MSPIATATDVSIASSMATRLHLSPVTTMGSRFALEPGRGDRRTPVLTSLGGVAAAVTVVVGALTLSSSLDGLLASPDRYGAPWDLIVSTGDQTESLTESILNDERVSAAAEAVVGELDVSVGSSPLQTTAIGITPVMGSMNAVVLDGHPPVGPNEVVLGTDTMRLLGVGIGETVDVSGPGGERPLTVVGRGIVPVLGNPNTGVGLVVPVDTFIALGGDRLAATIDVEHGVLLRFHDQHDAASVATELEAMGAGIDRPFRQSSVSVLDEIRAVPILIACFTAVLGGLATIDALIVTGRRRRSDLAVTRALGLRPRDAGRVLNWQGATLAAVALLIGVPLGLVAGAGVWRLVADRTNVLVVVDPPWLAIAAVGVTAIVGAGVVLAAAPAVAGRRRRPAADLRAE